MYEAAFCLVSQLLLSPSSPRGGQQVTNKFSCPWGRQARATLVSLRKALAAEFLNFMPQKILGLCRTSVKILFYY